MGHSTVVFSIGPINFTSQMLTMTGIVIILCIIDILAGRNPKKIPRGLQNLVEMGVEKFRNFMSQLIGEDLNRQYFPLFCTLFIFILVSNYSGMLPMMFAKVPGFAAPTSALSINAGLAVVVFLATQILGFKHNGTHYLGHFVSPYAFMLPLLLIEEIVHPVSLTLRLYGNVFGEESVTEKIAELVPLIAPIIFNVLGLLFGLIQALVFTMLSAIYISTAAGKGH